MMLITAMMIISEILLIILLLISADLDPVDRVFLPILHLVEKDDQRFSIKVQRFSMII